MTVTLIQVAQAFDRYIKEHNLKLEEHPEYVFSEGSWKVDTLQNDLQTSYEMKNINHPILEHNLDFEEM